MYRVGFFTLSRDEISEYIAFFNENDLNIEWLSMSDRENFILECIDGNWQIEILRNNNLLEIWIN